MREIVHLQAGQCGNQIGSKVSIANFSGFGNCKATSLRVKQQTNNPVVCMNCDAALHILVVGVVA